MRLYENTQVSHKISVQIRRERHCCWKVPHRQTIESQQQEGGDLIKPRKLPNPALASHQHRALHGELLLCHRRGLLPGKKPELQLVLEKKQREQHEQRELTRRPPSDLEAKLLTRRQRIQLCELEELKRSESLANVPEFVRVRETLRNIQTVPQRSPGHKATHQCS